MADSAPMPLLLDLFCYDGGAGMGYARAGFEVVGVDIEMEWDALREAIPPAYTEWIGAFLMQAVEVTA